MPHTSNSPQLADRSEAAVALGVSSATISRWINLGLLDVVRIGPQRTFITRESIDRLLRGGDDGQPR